MHPAAISRRDALARMGAVAAAIASACTPARLALGTTPGGFDDPATGEQALRAFVLTVVPGADPSSRSLTQCFSDELFPFRRYRAVFVADLSRRARSRYGQSSFERLRPHERREVVRDGLHGGWITGRLYAGAVFLAQLAVLGGIYAANAAVPQLGFDGEYRWEGLENVTWPEPARYLAVTRTSDGNPS
ncbi:MAG TPA: hypothetical protein VLL51_00045 [Gemmatimonadales bacterium]|nr:hypothetical protein [Gemmatimonadales bacterium]